MPHLWFLHSKHCDCIIGRYMNHISNKNSPRKIDLAQISGGLVICDTFFYAVSAQRQSKLPTWADTCHLCWPRLLQMWCKAYLWQPERRGVVMMRTPKASDLCWPILASVGVWTGLEEDEAGQVGSVSEWGRTSGRLCQLHSLGITEQSQACFWSAQICTISQSGTDPIRYPS